MWDSGTGAEKCVGCGELDSTKGGLYFYLMAAGISIRCNDDVVIVLFFLLDQSVT